MEYKINLMAPAVGDRLKARAEVVRPGRTLHVVNSNVFARQDGEWKQCAQCLATIICLEGRADRPEQAA